MFFTKIKKDEAFEISKIGNVQREAMRADIAWFGIGWQKDSYVTSSNCRALSNWKSSYTDTRILLTIS